MQPKVFVAVLASLAAVTASSEKRVYKAVGDTVVLPVDPVDDPVTSVTWKHGQNMATQWDGEETWFYGHFIGCSTLNSSTGALTITGLTGNHSGSYTLEINNHVIGTTQLLVISHVSKPSVSMWCAPEKTYCLLTCEGSTTDAEPIEYKWKTHDTTWPSTDVHNITKDEKEPWFSCLLKNPVSIESSDPVRNPFIPVGNRKWISPYLIPVLLLLLFSAAVTCKIRKGNQETSTNSPVSPDPSSEPENTEMSEALCLRPPVEEDEAQDEN